MKLKSENIQIDLEHPFEYDLLNRKQYADVLTQIVKNTEDGFTLSINADWGYGKTTFVKMWGAMLQSEGYKTIYFNAWESDFVNEPMSALIDGLRNTTFDQDFAFEQRKQLSATVDTIIGITRAIPVVKIIGDIGKAVKDGIDQCLEDTNDFQKTQSFQALVAEFKENLANYAKAISKDKPLIIFVDELDRCRPDYAVQMLERIKHFFAIDNIIFVLSVDKTVLCKSIKAIYGGLEIDTEGYLRRFVDLEFDLPKPDIDNFIEALYGQRLHEYVLNNKSYLEAWHGKNSDIQIPFFLTKFLNSTLHRSLRDIEKYFNLLEIVLRSSTPNAESFIYIMYFVYMYIYNRKMYNTFKNRQYTIEQLWTDLTIMVDIPYDKRDQLLEFHMSNILDIYTYYVANLKDSVESKKSDPFYLNGLGENYDCKFINAPYREMVQRMLTHNPHRGSLDSLYKLIELTASQFNWNKGASDDKS